MATVNIPSYHDDPNYRYKMPRVKAKVEGRGNGVKTNIMNMADIARALKRAPEYATKFCGCELGASSKFESAEGKAIVNGIHPEADVQSVIDKFVERFVLCPKCRLPEIDLGVVRGRVQGTCNACGYSGDMDNGHKVATYIVKNPPATNVSTVGKKGASASGDKEKRKSKSADKPKDAATSSKDGAKPKKDKPKKRHHHHHHHHHDRHSLGFDSEEIVNVIERLANYLLKGERPTHKDFFQEIRLLQVAQDFGGTLRVYCAISALHKALGGAELLTPEQLEKYKGYLAATCDRSIDGAMILEAFENFLYRQQPAAVWDTYAVLLSTLYQDDILDEECVLKRYGGVLKPAPSETASTVPEGASKLADAAPAEPVPANLAYEALERAHKAAASFVQWLKEAESASSSEDGEEGAAQTTAAAATLAGKTSENSDASYSSSLSDDEGL